MAIVTAILNTLIVVTCLFLICLILIQRGKGGGLAGAFGGVGGSSAFGTKAGDVFTRVTMVVATVWIFLSMILVVLYNQGAQSAWGNDSASSALTREVAPKPKAGTTPSTIPTVPSGTTTPSAIPSTTPTPGAPADVPAIPTTPAPAGAAK
ncbi:MAG: preprotein translocase subunit SecG [Isosphaeraceae bacterium]